DPDHHAADARRGHRAHAHHQGDRGGGGVPGADRGVRALDAAAARAEAGVSFWRKHITVLAALAVYLALYALASARYEGFLSLPVFINFLGDNAVVGIVAVGMTFVILSGGIDLSVG